MFEINQPELKEKTLSVKVPKKMMDQIDILVRKHKVKKPVVIRSLIEAGLRSI